MRHVFSKTALMGLQDLTIWEARLQRTSIAVSRKLRRVFEILGIAALLGGIVEPTVPSANAAFALKDALITIGIGAAVGTAIGASTLPFYSDVGDHVENVFLGAGAGAAAGLGLALYLIATPGEDVGGALTHPRDKGRALTAHPSYDNPHYYNVDDGVRPLDGRVFTSLVPNPLLRSTSSTARFRGQSALTSARTHEWKLAVNFFRVSF